MSELVSGRVTAFGRRVLADCLTNSPRPQAVTERSRMCAKEVFMRIVSNSLTPYQSLFRNFPSVPKVNLS
jgi:hypothetical protein